MYNSEFLSKDAHEECEYLDSIAKNSQAQEIKTLQNENDLQRCLKKKRGFIK